MTRLCRIVIPTHTIATITNAATKSPVEAANNEAYVQAAKQ